MRQSGMPELLLQGLAYLPWGWLAAFVFNLGMLVLYLDVRPEPGFLELLLVLLLQLALMVGVTLRFLVTLGNAEQQKIELEHQVAASLRQLEQVKAMARAAQQQSALAEEKRRIFHELHEDVGSKLLSIAHAGRDTRLGGLASSALANLRDAVSRANSNEISVHLFLVGLQEEMTLRLAGLGIALHWVQPSRCPEWTLSPEQHYHLSRIFRELVTNIIRHANATRVDFSASVDEGSWSFIIADNGAGFDIAQPGGAGIKAVRNWATALGAESSWDTQPGTGLLFRLTLPAQVSPANAKIVS